VKIVFSLVAIAVLLTPRFALGQTAPNGLFKTTLCDLVKNPGRFGGKIVQFRAEYITNLQGSRFIDGRCGAEVQLGVHHIFDDLKPGLGQYAYTEAKDEQSEEFKHSDLLSWKTVQPPVTVHLLQDENYRNFRKFVDAKFRWKDGGLCRNCPLFRTSATATGAV
jgi:hypothetical protein